MIPLIRELHVLSKNHPRENTKDLLERLAFRDFLRNGYTRIHVKYLFKLNQFIDLKYSPDQPRVPAGEPDGGQWTSDSSATENDNSSELQFVEDEFQSLPIILASEINSFSKHALNQAINREVKPDAILDAVKNPLDVQYRDNGTIRYIGKDAVVVLNPQGNVVTIWGQ